MIARAHGSLTKFMPDDVPGVTSPMVYIGMLYSWFAWHIEDHELHSLNFLHTGAPKTWYAVPSDHAAQLEEIIRLKGYGGTFDQLGMEYSYIIHALKVLYFWPATCIEPLYYIFVHSLRN